jgi:hypothetical protein
MKKLRFVWLTVNAGMKKAFVVRRNGADITAGAIQAFVRQRKSKAQWLVGGVEFLDKIPLKAP